MEKPITTNKALVTMMGWEPNPETGAEEFVARLVFPNGPPRLSLHTVWEKRPVTVIEDKP